MFKNLQKAENRNPAMDIIRIVSVFLVMSVHFFLYTGFYDQPMLGKRMLAMCIMRTFLSCCVPMFILLSGYLLCHKKLEKKYYSGLSKTLLTYVLAGAACILYRAAHMHQAYTWRSALFSFLDYSAAQYAWYIEMYIGLFLLVPFLNLAYHGLKSQKQKQLLVLTMVLLTAAPTLFNSFNLELPGWWAEPASTDALTNLLPQWWAGFYPVTFYFTGCYLREYGLAMKSRTLALLLALTTLGFSLFNIWRSYGVVFQYGLYNNWQGFQPYVTAVLLFALLSRIKGEKLPVQAKFLLWKVSDLCLGMYLVSYIFDKYFYEKLRAALPAVTSSIVWFPLVVPCVFLCSLALAAALQWLERLLAWLAPKALRALRAALAQDRARVMDVCFCLLLCGAGALALWKCRYGFGGADEAFYLTIPHRLVMGDRLFADEWHLSQLSGVLNVPFVWLYRAFTGGTEGIILAARYLYVVFHGLVAVFCYARLRKYGFAALPAAGLYFLYTPYDIMALSYNTMGIDFLLLAGLLLATFEKPLCFVLGGLCLSASVLCCPYLAGAYLAYGAAVAVCALRKKKGGFFDAPRFLWCSLGVGAAAGAFLVYICLTCGLGAVWENLPRMLQDPEHPPISLAVKLKNYFLKIYTCHPWFKVPLVGWLSMLAAMALDRNRRNHRAFYLLLSGLFTLAAFAMFCPQSTTKYFNAILFPMVFLGLPAYILCEEKPKALFYGVFLGGMLYSVAVTFSSNQYFNAVSMAVAVSNVASPIFLAQAWREMKRRPDEVAYGVALRKCCAALAIVAVLVQGYMQARVKAHHCFMEEGPGALTCTIQAGPGKGIATTEEKLAQYTQVYDDMACYQTAPEGNFLLLADWTWCYLAADPLPYGTFSGWTSGEGPGALERLEGFYNGNPGKAPRYIYIPKASIKGLDVGAVLAAARGKGYQLAENEVSYKLER